ncbi:hypothetical protein C7S16_2976 [Burkholderia thailandensis]|uniref:Uncharacterized protein n=1 Tax=Burkholderia thailandensis TaxID=57975 RepID=A0AAW9D586_BURTH|nr:hypothetical protein [Burkholderia thailandensis]
MRFNTRQESWLDRSGISGCPRHFSSVRQTTRRNHTRDRPFSETAKIGVEMAAPQAVTAV